MSIDIKTEGKVLTVYFNGEIDHHTCELIRTEIDNRIARTTPEEVNLELSAVTFMDSSGIGLIMGRYKKLKNMGAMLKVVSPKPQIRRMIEMSGITKLIEVV